MPMNGYINVIVLNPVIFYSVQKKTLRGGLYTDSIYFQWSRTVQCSHCPCQDELLVSVNHLITLIKFRVLSSRRPSLGLRKLLNLQKSLKGEFPLLLCGIKNNMLSEFFLMTTIYNTAPNFKIYSDSPCILCCFQILRKVLRFLHFNNLLIFYLVQDMIALKVRQNPRLK